MKTIRKFDLKDRILTFVLKIISFSRNISKDNINMILVNQLIRSATSIGANYQEADGSRSKKEFISIMGIVRKEAKETEYWLEILSKSSGSYYGEINKIKEECNELIRIFSKIIINSKP